MMDFSGHAGATSDFDTLPKGYLCWAYLGVRGVKSSASGGGYIDCELTVAEGQPYAGRKFWEMIGDPNNQGNSEKYRQMGTLAITRILESGRGAGPNNVAGYQIDSFEQLNGLKVAVKVGVEAGKDGHDDKNRVAEWLTPNPASQSGYKGYAKLIAGDHGLQQQAAGAIFGVCGFGGGQSAAPANTGGFGGGQPAAAQSGGAPSGFGSPQQTGANGASAATGQQTGSGFASTGTATSQSHSDPGATPGWLQQAGGGQTS